MMIPNESIVRPLIHMMSGGSKRGKNVYNISSGDDKIHARRIMQTKMNDRIVEIAVTIRIGDFTVTPELVLGAPELACIFFASR
ncbi:MAG: hypothetical protein PVG65_05725 [Candidatus Thorarchaeota archaeon]|jgi:hypothetical protein